MAFHVILIPPGLSERNQAQAAAAGPAYVSASASYPDLLALAGFGEIDEVDLTDQFRVTATAWLHESARAAEQLEEVFGSEDYRKGQQERAEIVSAVEGGLLRRSLFAAESS